VDAAQQPQPNGGEHQPAGGEPLGADGADQPGGQPGGGDHRQRQRQRRQPGLDGGEPQDLLQVQGHEEDRGGDQTPADQQPDGDGPGQAAAPEDPQGHQGGAVSGLDRHERGQQHRGRQQ
jgi:hypothetical protein